MAETAYLEWDKTGARFYETGVKKGVLYPYNPTTKKYSPGVAWNGLTAVTESPSGAEATALYADDIKYLNLLSNEEFGCTVEAYTYPDEFAQCDGTASPVAGMSVGQQARKTFGLSYVTTVGNDENGNDHGFKIHLVYGCLAAPSEKGYATINDSPEAITFSWEVTTTPVEVKLGDGKTYKPTACITIDSTKFAAGENGEMNANLKALCDKLWAKENAELPLPAEVYTLLGGTVAGA